LYTIKVLII